MKRIVWCVCLLALLLFGCTPAGNDTAETTETAAQSQATETTAASTQKGESQMLRMRIDDTDVQVRWEDNASVDALTALAASAPVVIGMSGYGGFEQVGSIGSELPRNDKQTTTSAGDIVLYAGDQIVVFYGSNAWAYTRLGKIEGMDGKALTALLGQNDVTLTLFAEAAG